nr:dehydrogenase/reductase SDR family member 12 isoform X5 [Globicephala melas]
MLLYRSAVWFAKGLREYTKRLCSQLLTAIPSVALLLPGVAMNLRPRTSTLMTWTSKSLEEPSWSPGGTAALEKQLPSRSPGENIFLHIVDLSDPKTVWKFVENFKQEHTLNVLINNAGCMVNKRELTEDGLEKNFATNTLGVYVLTTALIPVLEKEHDPRVVTVSSGGMLVQKLNTDDLQSERTAFDGTMVYAQNKRQQVVLTEQWARAHPAIHFSCMHPGWVDTPGVRLSMPGFHARLGARLRSEAQGADTVLWLALAPTAAVQPSGRFFQVIEISPVLYTKPSIEAVTHHLLTVGPQVGYLPSGGLIFPVSGDFSATDLKGWF